MKRDLELPNYPMRKQAEEPTDFTNLAFLMENM